MDTLSCIIGATKSLDTTLEARKVLIEIYRKMSPSAKTARIFDAYRIGKILAMADVRNLYPEANEKKICCLWVKRDSSKLLKEIIQKCN